MTLMVDALFPAADPVPDMEAVGADVLAIYCLRRNANGADIGIGGASLQVVRAALGAGKAVVPIVVPGDVPPQSDWQAALDAAHALGIPTGAIVVDLEQFSLPAPSWVLGFRDHARAAGWKVLRYGDTAVLSGYPPCDGDWVSHGLIPVRLGEWEPVPALPAGVWGDQYAVQVTINGHSYDVSIIEGVPMAVDPAKIDAMSSKVDDMWKAITSTNYGDVDPNNQPLNPMWMIAYMYNMLKAEGVDAIAKAVVAALPPSAGGPSLTADDVAQAVLKALAGKLA